MECKEFNERITEYETKMLSKKQEKEFLRHKDSCKDCGEVYNIIFSDLSKEESLHDILNFDEYDEILNDNCCDLCFNVMDKIKDMDSLHYNFKVYNALNIFFGLIAFLVVILGITEVGENFFRFISSDYATTAISSSNGGIFGSSLFNLPDVYVSCIVYLAGLVILSAFILTIVDAIKERKVEKKHEIQHEIKH